MKSLTDALTDELVSDKKAFYKPEKSLISAFVSLLIYTFLYYTSGMNKDVRKIIEDKKRNSISNIEIDFQENIEDKK